MSARLHLGCGDKILPRPWVNADAKSGTSVDLVIDLHDPWQLQADEYEWIYTSHVIEHLYPDRLPRALTLLHRALRPGGLLTLATISLEGIYQNAFLKGYPPEAVNAYLYGDAKTTDSPLAAHRQCFTEPYLTDLMRKAGFATVRPWSLTQYPEIKALNDCASSSYHVTLYLEGLKT